MRSLKEIAGHWLDQVRALAPNDTVLRHISASLDNYDEGRVSSTACLQEICNALSSVPLVDCQKLLSELSLILPRGTVDMAEDPSQSAAILSSFRLQDDRAFSDAFGILEKFERGEFDADQALEQFSKTVRGASTADPALANKILSLCGLSHPEPRAQFQPPCHPLILHRGSGDPINESVKDDLLIENSPLASPKETSPKETSPKEAKEASPEEAIIMPDDILCSLRKMIGREPPTPTVKLLEELCATIGPSSFRCVQAILTAWWTGQLPSSDSLYLLLENSVFPMEIDELPGRFREEVVEPLELLKTEGLVTTSSGDSSESERSSTERWIGPSYHYRSDSETKKIRCSGEMKLDPAIRKEINRTMVSISHGTEDSTVPYLRRPSAEESMFRCEEQMFEHDIRVELTESLSQALKDEDIIYSGSGMLMVCQLRPLLRVFGESAEDVLELLKRHPDNVRRPLASIMTERANLLREMRDDTFNKSILPTMAECFFEQFDIISHHVAAIDKLLITEANIQVQHQLLYYMTTDHIPDDILKRSKQLFRQIISGGGFPGCPSVNKGGAVRHGQKQHSPGDKNVELPPEVLVVASINVHATDVFGIARYKAMKENLTNNTVLTYSINEPSLHCVMGTLIGQYCQMLFGERSGSLRRLKAFVSLILPCEAAMAAAKQMTDFDEPSSENGEMNDEEPPDIIDLSVAIGNAMPKTQYLSSSTLLILRSYWIMVERLELFKAALESRRDPTNPKSSIPWSLEDNCPEDRRTFDDFVENVLHPATEFEFTSELRRSVGIECPFMWDFPTLLSNLARTLEEHSGQRTALMMLAANAAFFEEGSLADCGEQQTLAHSIADTPLIITYNNSENLVGVFGVDVYEKAPESLCKCKDKSTNPFVFTQDEDKEICLYHVTKPEVLSTALASANIRRRGKRGSAIRAAVERMKRLRKSSSSPINSSVSTRLRSRKE